MTGGAPQEDSRTAHAQMMSGAHLREGWDALATMLSAMLLFGLPGWWASEVTGWVWVLPVALVLGMGVAVALVWFRYGTQRP